MNGDVVVGAEETKVGTGVHTPVGVEISYRSTEGSVKLLTIAQVMKEKGQNDA